MEVEFFLALFLVRVKYFSRTNTDDPKSKQMLFIILLLDLSRFWRYLRSRCL